MNTELDICNICNVCRPIAVLYLVVVRFSFFVLSIVSRAIVRNSFILVLLSYVYRRSIDLSLLYLTGSSDGSSTGSSDGSHSAPSDGSSDGSRSSLEKLPVV